MVSQTWQNLGVDYADAFAGYQKYVCKPLEFRTRKPSLANGADMLSLLVAPIGIAEMSAPDDISLPEQQDWELRLVIWKTRDIQPDEGDTWIDMFVSSIGWHRRLERNGCSLSCQGWRGLI